MEKRLVALSYFTCTVLQVLPNFFLGPNDIETCADCPENLALITRRSGAGRHLPGAFEWGRDSGLVGVVVTLVGRWRRWPQVKRSALAPVLWTGGVGLFLIVVGLAIRA